MVALDKFQHEIIHLHDETLRELRITKAIVPLESAPEVYLGPHAGFPLVKGDTFSVKLNNGQTVTAE